MQNLKSQLSVQKLVRLTAKPERQSELRDMLQILESATRAEPGCIEFTFLQSISDDSLFVLLEHFASEEALKTHMQLPHTQTVFKAQLVASMTAIDVSSLGGPQLNQSVG